MAIGYFKGFMEGHTFIDIIVTLMRLEIIWIFSRDPKKYISMCNVVTYILLSIVSGSIYFERYNLQFKSANKDVYKIKN